MANSPQPVAILAPCGAAVSAQIIVYTIKSQPLPIYKESMNYKVIETWIYSFDNYILVTSLTDSSQLAHFSATLM